MIQFISITRDILVHTETNKWNSSKKTTPINVCHINTNVCKLKINYAPIFSKCKNTFFCNRTVYNVMILCKSILRLLLKVLNSTFCFPTFDFTASFAIFIYKLVVAKLSAFANLHFGCWKI